jgi:hypothetical protein
VGRSVIIFGTESVMMMDMHPRLCVRFKADSDYLTLSR